MRGHLRSKADATALRTQRTTETAAPVAIAKIQDIEVIVDGYRRMKTIGTEAPVRVHVYTVDNVKEALFLRARLNLDSSRSLSKFEAVCLLIVLFGDDLEALKARKGGRGNKTSCGYAETFLASRWNDQGWEPRLSHNDVKAGRAISKCKDIGNLVEEHLTNGDPISLSKFASKFITSVDYFSSKQAAFPPKFFVETAASDKIFGDFVRGDANWAVLRSRYHQAWAALKITPPHPQSHVIQGLRRRKFVNGDTLNLVADLLNALDTPVFVAGIELTALGIESDRALINARWISKSMSLRDLLGRDKIVFFLNFKNEHWTVLVAEPKEERFVHLDSLLEFKYDPTDHIAHLRRVLQCYADGNGIETSVASWRVQSARSPPQQHPESNDCALYCCLFAVALVLDTGLPPKLTPAALISMRKQLAVHFHLGESPMELLERLLLLLPDATQLLIHTGSPTNTTSTYFT